jgi:osmotically-inducible protein OsmY
VKLPDDARRSDTEIAGAVRRALERDVRVPAARLQSTVSAGVITLEGRVSNLQQRRDAEAAIAHLFGVRRVLNHIEIEPPAAKRAS